MKKYRKRIADALNGEVYHYRDKERQKYNTVIHLRNGKYGLIL